MGDHFVLLVDRLLTESTLGAAIESRNRFLEAAARARDEEINAKNPSHKIEFGDVVSPGKMVECRICQDEDEDRNMETPCSCCGSLKYAHRRCVQRWCDEKGNTVCEICHQQFKPGYTAPPPLYHLGRIPMNFRGNWEIYREESHNSPRFITMVSADRSSSNTENHEQPDSFTNSLMCCHSIAVILMVLLVLRHTLPILISGSNVYSFPLIMLLFLRSVGIVLPIYLIMRVLSAIQRHRYRQAPNFLHTTMVSSSSSSFASSDEEVEEPSLQPQGQVIQ